MNNEGVKYEQILFENISYHLFNAMSDAYDSTIVWDKDGARYTISSSLTIEDLLDVAKSVRAL
ncbi:hypothetical protein FACS1894202_08520 [Clostridia bacterium]|nr:hypothetical protein FACS1894202_08520 [Clostridia bacterium]